MPAEQFFILLAIICMAPKLTEIGAMLMCAAFLFSSIMWIAFRLLA